jgi:protein-tyrosine phosphatase
MKEYMIPADMSVFPSWMVWRIYRDTFQLLPWPGVTMFRRVDIPDSIPGKLYLTVMPGRFESIGEFISRIISLSIQEVVCLTPLEEIEERSVEYYHLITSGDYPWHLEHFPIPDFGVPSDTGAFILLSKRMAESLLKGDNLVIHCYAGIGRTGILAMVTLMALGMKRAGAAAAVRKAQAQPEGLSNRQRSLIDLCERELRYGIVS